MNRIVISAIAFAIVLVSGYFLLLEPAVEPKNEAMKQSATAVVRSGQDLFAENCASCHGVDLKGTDAGPPFLHKVYEPSHHSDDAFYYAVKRGVRAHHWSFGNMPPVEGVTDAEIAEIITYIRKLQRAVGIN